MYYTYSKYEARAKYIYASREAHVANEVRVIMATTCMPCMAGVYVRKNQPKSFPYIEFKYAFSRFIENSNKRLQNSLAAVRLQLL